MWFRHHGSARNGGRLCAYERLYTGHLERLPPLGRDSFQRPARRHRIPCIESTVYQRFFEPIRRDARIDVSILWQLTLS